MSPRLRIALSQSWVVVAVILAAGAGASLATPGPDKPTTTIALLAVAGERQPAAAVVERLETALLQQPNLALVERAQLEKILAEQQLTASALVDLNQRVRLGQVVPANLLVFLDSIPRLPKPATRIQVTESKTGIVLASQIYENEALLKNPQPLLDLVQIAVAKRAVATTKRHLLGYLDFRSEESGPMLDSLAAALGTLVITDLARVPNIVVLEREHLQHLQTERELTSLEQDLRTSVRLLEGGLRRTANTNELTVTVSLRPLASGEPLVATLTIPAGDPLRARDLISVQVTALLKTKRPDSARIDRAQEAAVFASHALLWRAWGDKARAVQAAETAFALEPGQSNRLLVASSLVYTNPTVAEVIRSNELLLDYYQLHHAALQAGTETSCALPFLGYRTESFVTDPALQRSEDAVFRAQLDQYAQAYDRAGLNYWKAWTDRLNRLADYHAGQPQQQAELIREAVRCFAQPPGRPDWAPAERLQILADLPFWMLPRMRPDRRPLFTDAATKALFQQVLQEMTTHPDPYVRVIGYRATEKLLEVGFFMARRSQAEKLEMYRCREGYLRILTEEMGPTHPYRAGHFEGQMNHGRSNESLTLADVGFWAYDASMPAAVFAKEQDFARRLLEALIATGDPARLEALYSASETDCKLLERVGEYGRPADAVALADRMLALYRSVSNGQSNHERKIQDLRNRFQRLITGAAPPVAQPPPPVNGPGWDDYTIRQLDLHLSLHPWFYWPRPEVLLLADGNRLYCLRARPGADGVDLVLTTHWLPPGGSIERREIPVHISHQQHAGYRGDWITALCAAALAPDAVYAGTTAGLVVISRQTNAWTLITQKEGLPGSIVRALGWFKGKLYLGIGGEPFFALREDQSVFASYDPQTKTFAIIAAEKAVGPATSWNGVRFSVDDIVPDEAQDCLWLKDRERGVWKFSPATHAFTQVIPDKARVMFPASRYIGTYKSLLNSSGWGWPLTLFRPDTQHPLELPTGDQGLAFGCSLATVALDGERLLYGVQSLGDVVGPQGERGANGCYLYLFQPGQPLSRLVTMADGAPFPGAALLYNTPVGIVSIAPSGEGYLISRRANAALYRLAELQAASGQPRETALLDAAEAGRLAEVQQLLASGVDRNAVDRHGWTPLDYAIDRRHPNLAVVLIRNGADINRPTEAGCPPLTLAAGKNEVDVVRELLARGAAVDQTGKDCLTPVAAAAVNGATEAVQLLVVHGADVNRRETSGNENTILMSTAFAGHRAAVELLLAHGAAIEGTDQNGNTALMCAAVAGQTNVLACLIAHHAELDATNQRGGTALMQAVDAGRLPAAEVLLTAGADPNRGSPLKVAAKTKRADLVRCLLDHHANVNATDEMGRPALAWAAWNGNIEIMKLLLGAGAVVIVERPGQEPFNVIDFAQSADGRALLRAALPKPPLKEPSK